MGDTERKIDKILQILLALVLVLFPFGQLLRIESYSLGIRVVFHPMDLAVGVIFIVFLLLILLRKINLEVHGYFASLGFGSLVFLMVLGSNYDYSSLLYLLRLFAYFSLIPVILSLVKRGGKMMQKLRRLINVSLVLVLVAGWIQYLFFWDLRDLYYFGWDDHLFRLAGAFLDPGLTGIILVFGFAIFYWRYLKEGEKRRDLLLFIVFFVSVFFTYARSAYLALLALVLYFFALKLGRKILAKLIVFSVFIIILLPRPYGEGVNLARTYSVDSRIENYQQTLQVFFQNPLFGVSYNNLCWARQEYLGESNTRSHSCYGSDSSLLLVLATGGVVGGLLFLDGFRKMFVQGDVLFRGMILSLLVHSSFVNSLFYPWVLVVLVTYFVSGRTKENT